MSVDHHGKQSDIMRRFIDQMDGTARREYPAGRMGAEDDGALSFAIAADRFRGTIVIRFGKPVEWIGLGLAEATQLRDMLTERLVELRTGEPLQPVG